MLTVYNVAHKLQLSIFSVTLLLSESICTALSRLVHHVIVKFFTVTSTSLEDTLIHLLPANSNILFQPSIVIDLGTKTRSDVVNISNNLTVSPLSAALTANCSVE
jgi:hypothetical protein